MNDYDDPYKLLAATIVGSYRPADVARLLGDDVFLLTQIDKEVREQDFQGHFLDCIIEDILSKKQRMEYMSHLDELAKYYYQKIDKDRLRKEILALLRACGIEVEYYSATGNILSANA